MPGDNLSAPLRLWGDEDLLVRERYEVVHCQGKLSAACHETWATGRFLPGGEVACVGLRVVEDVDEKWLPARRFRDCPMHQRETEEELWRQEEVELAKDPKGFDW